ncbi:MAG: winged helix-turn-helix domain-containing protein [Rhodocyclaceae bacterium]|nr:winged helix-turn-helix domain-containing protein [Rhodocyclaceae bacterium]
MIYRFEDIELDTDRFELRRSGTVRAVEPQVFSLLELLFANPDRLITKDELNERIWKGRIVSEAVVNSRIRSARQAIGDDGKAQRLIRTVHRRGFRFLVTPEVVSAARPVGVVVETAAAPPPEPAIAPSPPAESSGPPSIAVLPFQWLSIDGKQAMLADAVAHELIVELSRLHWLVVIARGSSFQFRGPGIDLTAAGQRLGARYLLTGTVAVEGKRSAVSVELVRADDQHLLWADRFEGPVEDLLGLRSTMARDIVSTIDYRIPIAEATRAAATPTENLDAWGAYHRGLWHMYRFSAGDNAQATQLFEHAIRGDPHFARAHAALSFTHFQNAFLGYKPDVTAERRLPREFAEKGLALDPLDPFSNLCMGRADWLEGDMEGAFPWYDRCIELNPNFAFAHYNRALADVIAGRGERCDAGIGKAMSLSPIDPLRYAHLGTRAFSHMVQGDYAGACDWAEQAARAPNAHVHIYMIAALVSELAGNRAAADTWATEVRRRMNGYRPDRFFKSFPFRDTATCETIQGAFARLGF